jgi:acyl-CoA synthetase (AMP-forming)/AMP-acid ligase II
MPERGVGASLLSPGWFPHGRPNGDNGRMTAYCNIAARLPELARERPGQIALRCPGRAGRYDIELTYAQLDARSDAIAAGLAGYGIGRGTRTVVMVRPSPAFFLLMFALFKAGAVPVLVDPGIDRRALKQCLDEAQPEAFIGIPLAQAARLVLGWARSARKLVTVGPRLAWGGTTLARIERAGAGAGPQLADTDGDEVAGILFTSGSTGVPKGVVYRHRHFAGQVELLRHAFGMLPGGVDLPTFPPFALFDPALGLTSVIPDMDPTRPAQADPAKLHAAIERFGVTQLFGSPALMRVLAEYGRPLPTVKRVTSAGAPVPPEIVEKIRALLPDDAQFWTPYGATECLPVAVIEGRELDATRQATEAGAGTCVGHAVAPNVVRVIAIDDAPIADWSGVRELGPGDIGEITVAGPTATDSYFNRDAATAIAKVREPLADGGSRIVHRMGDVGYFDTQGRLWFCGRKTQRVETPTGPRYTEQAEPVFNVHPEVRRTALVGVGAPGAQRPVLCFELLPEVSPQRADAVIADLRAIAGRHAHLQDIDTFLHHPGFPVDIRHNAKIGRETLSRWAARQQGRKA